MLHKELMCEECCDLSHHRDHNNQILLLKAAAQNFLADVDYHLQALLEQRATVSQCEGFHFKSQVRRQILDFF